MWAVGVFLLCVSGAAWLFPRELCKKFLSHSGAGGGTFEQALEDYRPVFK